MSQTKQIKFLLFQFLIFALVLFQILDGSCTYLGLLKYGIDIEGNPLMVYSILKFGYFWGLAIPKLIGIGLILFVYYAAFRDRKITIFGLSIMILLNIFYAWVVFNWVVALFFGI